MKWPIKLLSKPLVNLITAALVALLCTCSSHAITEDTFFARTDAEREARDRMRHWAGMAEAVSDLPELSTDQRAQIRAKVAAMRSALGTYNQLRARGTTRAMIIAPISASAAGIVADDVTGVGIANDVLLAPLALAAIATYAITDARASQNQLALSWNQVLSASGDLATTIDTVLLAASLGSRRQCIELYVDCQHNAHKDFSRRWCQFCLDRCLGDNFTWPDIGECDYQ